MDDFLRNFFVKMGLARTCEAFEAEWYELKAMGKLEGSQLVPDIYQRNAVRNAVVIVWGLCARSAVNTHFVYGVSKPKLQPWCAGLAVHSHMLAALTPGGAGTGGGGGSSEAGAE